MAQQLIQTGTLANDGTGDPLRTSFTKVNSNFTELYNAKNALATVANSGSYNDLVNKPSLFSGSYTDLTDKPSLFSGNYDDLSDKPTLFSGSYNDLTDTPSLFSGSYNDLTDTPSIPTSIGDFVDVDGNLVMPTATPDTSKGVEGDKAGAVAFDDNYIYRCTVDYTDGVADIWKRVAWSNDTW